MPQAAGDGGGMNHALGGLLGFVLALRLSLNVMGRVATATSAPSESATRGIVFRDMEAFMNRSPYISPTG